MDIRTTQGNMPAAVTNEVSDAKLGLAFRTILAALSPEQCLMVLQQIKGFLLPDEGMNENE